MAPAADRGNHHCMAMTIKQLRAASDDDLIEAHDEVASYTEATYGGSSTFLPRLRRCSTACRAWRASANGQTSTGGSARAPVLRRWS